MSKHSHTRSFERRRNFAGLCIASALLLVSLVVSAGSSGWLTDADLLAGLFKGRAFALDPIGEDVSVLADVEPEGKKNSRVVVERLHLPSSLQAEASRTIAPDHATHASIVARPGVKIGVRQDGFYRVSSRELKNAGFDLSIAPDLWQLYLEGNEQAIIVGPNADYIEFYGRGFDSQESDTRMYYLVSGTSSGKRIQMRAVLPSAKPPVASNYLQSVLIKDRSKYFKHASNGEVENYFGSPIIPAGDTNFDFTLTGVDPRGDNATVDLRLQGFTWTAHTVSVKLNGKALASATGKGRGPFSRTYTVPSALLREGDNTMTLRALGGPGDSSLFDSLSVSYKRKYVAGANRLSFYTPDRRRVTLSGFSSPKVRVFDMTVEDEPVLLNGLSAVKMGSAYGVMLPADRGRIMYAVEDSGLLSAAAVDPNDPATLSDSSHEADLVIISHSRFMDQAQAWAAYRREQGSGVKVIDVAEIYDEFSYGVRTSAAIRKFLQYAHNNWRKPPSYVLFLGDASVDSRNYEGHGYNNLVPTKVVTMNFGEAPSDEVLGDFNNDGLAEMSIGRIPARETKDLANVFAKVKAWERKAPTFEEDGALFVYDNLTKFTGNDFQGLSTRLKGELGQTANTSTIGIGDSLPSPETPQTRLVSQLNSGKFLVNYTGHGLTRSWAAPSFFSDRNVPQLTNADNPSIFTMFSCLNGYFVHSTEKSLAETLLDAPNGGAVAVWASTSETTLPEQEAMAVRFYKQLATGRFQRLGDLIRDAKSLRPPKDVGLSWVLLGDPMLRIHN